LEGLEGWGNGHGKYSKSRVPWGRVGSIPTAGTNHFKRLLNESDPNIGSLFLNALLLPFSDFFTPLLSIPGAAHFIFIK